MKDRHFDCLIVGAGAGGATLARELTRRGKSVIVLEKGVDEIRIGTFWDSTRYFDTGKVFRFPRSSREGVIIWHTFMSGGSTMVSCGNGVRCLENELAGFGIDLNEEFAEIDAEILMADYDIRRLSSGTKKILEAASELGYHMEPMPKFIDVRKCVRCGNCQLGCSHGAKWTSKVYLDEAAAGGAEILHNSQVESVIIENGIARGVRTKQSQQSADLFADTVVLAAGGLGTPVILQRSGIDKAGSRLFIDIIVNTYARVPGLSQMNEPTMSLVDREFHESEGFILSPFINQPRLLRFIELGVSGMIPAAGNLLGIMTKISDDSEGSVSADGTIIKKVTEKDRKRLDRGYEISRQILIKCGAKPGSVMRSKAQGGHPGGTAAVGEVVDNDLQTDVRNLFVCDASVLPTSPGLPPILTLVALAKRLAKHLS